MSLDLVSNIFFNHICFFFLCLDLFACLEDVLMYRKEHTPPLLSAATILGRIIRVLLDKQLINRADALYILGYRDYKEEE